MDFKGLIIRFFQGLDKNTTEIWPDGAYAGVWIQLSNEKCTKQQKKN